MQVIKSNGKLEPFDINKIREVYKRVCHGYNTVCPFDKLEHQLKTFIVDEIKTSDINKMIIKSANDLISVENTGWQFIAGRFYMLNIYKEVRRET